MTDTRGCHYIAGAWLADAPNGMIGVENPSGRDGICRSPQRVPRTGRRGGDGGTRRI